MAGCRLNHSHCFPILVPRVATDLVVYKAIDFIMQCNSKTLAYGIMVGLPKPAALPTMAANALLTLTMQEAG